MIAELLAGDLLHLFDIFHDLGKNLIVDFLTVLIILRAGLGGNGKALRHRQPDIGHFRKVGALAAQQLPHGSVAFGEQVAVLFAHMISPLIFARNRLNI